ncbi:MAG: hypothetical protein ACLP9S_01295 [Syntrophales bacterium]
MNIFKTSTRALYFMETRRPRDKQYILLHFVSRYAGSGDAAQFAFIGTSIIIG